MPVSVSMSVSASESVSVSMSMATPVLVSVSVAVFVSVSVALPPALVPPALAPPVLVPPVLVASAQPARAPNWERGLARWTARTGVRTSLRSVPRPSARRRRPSLDVQLRLRQSPRG